ncbi:MAG TPA: ABC transporter permease [Gammaproteobacteria bacterium]|nr:ABC transporter permease [Gammaproteobacteria bacterium]
MNGLLIDIRFGLKLLAYRPAFAAAAILTLALGIGANTAVFSVLNGYLLKPLPYPNVSQLARVDETEPKAGVTFGNMSIPMYFDIREHVSAFAEFGLYKYASFNVESHGQATRVVGARVTPSIFAVLGVKPFLGRTFAPDAIEPGRGHEVVLSYALWRHRFGGDTGIIGQSVQIAGTAYHVVGVMPKGFAFPDRSREMWAPLTISAQDRANKNMFSFSPDMLVRYRAGVDVAVARQQLRQVLAVVAGQSSADDRQWIDSGGMTFTLTSWHKQVVGDKAETALLLQAAVLFLLLITCVNVANLLLSRILGRTHEIALRAALGASRARLARQLLVESLCLALPGGIVGVALGWWSLHFFASSAIGPGNAILNIQPDWRVAGFAVAIVGLTGILVSLLPLWHLGRTDLQGLLQEGSRMAGGRRARLVRQMLVVVELCFATALLAGSGLLLHSLIKVQAVNPGYRTDHVLLTSLAVPSNEYQGDSARRRFYADVQKRIQSIPGVREAGLTRVLPFGAESDVSNFGVHGRKMTNTSTYIQPIGDRFFSSLNVSLLRGRGFDARDTANSQPVVVINSKLARVAFPHKSPMGQQIRVAGAWRTVIGVVPTIKIYSLSEPEQRGTAYVPLTQFGWLNGMGITIETSVPPASLSNAVRQAVHSLDPAVLVYGIKPLHARMQATLGARQATMNLVLVFGGIALALAFVGVYGVLSYAVRQRTTECGVRLALGALPEDLLWLVIKDGLKLLVTGGAAGLILAVGFGFALSSRLFDVAPYDPLTLIGVAVVLSAITLIACYLPARRAARIDPATAMMEQ